MADWVGSQVGRQGGYAREAQHGRISLVPMVIGQERLFAYSPRQAVLRRRKGGSEPVSHEVSHDADSSG